MLIDRISCFPAMHVPVEHLFSYVEAYMRSRRIAVLAFSSSRRVQHRTASS